MKDFFEIRWHGRGGQGAKTIALLFADSALSIGKYIQAFPEYGPERMGAPVQSFNRLADKPINIHCAIENPDVVVVLDSTLMDSIDTTAGIVENGILLINTKQKPDEIRKHYKIRDDIKIFTVDASKIAIEEFNVNKPNTPMLGALIKATNILELEKMIMDIKKKLEVKFRNKQEIIEGNLKSIRRAYEEVCE